MLVAVDFLFATICALMFGLIFKEAANDSITHNMQPKSLGSHRRVNSFTILSDGPLIIWLGFKVIFGVKYYMGSRYPKHLCH